MIDRLAGEWAGSGEGNFAGEAFAFEETIWFEQAPGRPMLYYRLLATEKAGGHLIHAESGLWLIVDDAVTISIALPRATEISEGSVVGDEIEVSSSYIGVASTVSEPHLIASERRYRCDGERLEYDIAIAMTGGSPDRHVWAALTRKGT